MRHPLSLVWFMFLNDEDTRLKVERFANLNLMAAVVMLSVSKDLALHILPFVMALGSHIALAVSSYIHKARTLLEQSAFFIVVDIIGIAVRI